MTTIVIDRKCLPARSPLTFLAVVALIMDRYGSVPGWAWGVYWTLGALLYAGYWAALWREKCRVIPGFGEQP